MVEKERKGLLYYYECAALIAIEIMLAFSAWGYVKLEYVSITFVPVVVLAMAYLLGPWEGLWGGVIFGITGMWKASVVTMQDAYANILFSPFRSGKSMQSVLLCFVPHIVLGLLAGILYAQVKKSKKWQPLLIAISTIVVLILHTVLVFALMQGLFPEAGAVWWTPLLHWHITGMDIEIVSAVAVLLALYFLWQSAGVKDKITKIREGVQANKYTKVVYWQWSALIVVAACGLSVCWDLKDGINGIVQSYDIMPGETSTDVMHALLIQFMVAQLAIFVLIGIMQSLIYYYYASAEMRSRMDMMTGAFNRTMLISTIEHDLKSLKRGQKVMFIMMDVDYFKQINDTY